MLKLVVTSRFKKDCKLARERGFDMGLLEAVLDALCAEEPLPARCRDHALVGSYRGFRECHIQSDWLLVYAIDDGRLVLTATRTGTHADLFDE